MANFHYDYDNVNSSHVMDMLRQLGINDLKLFVDAHRHPFHYTNGGPTAQFFDPSVHPEWHGQPELSYITEIRPGQTHVAHHHSPVQTRPVSSVSNPQRSRNIAEIIRKYDRNGDGKISVDEIEAVLRDLGVGVVSPRLARVLFEMVDENKNGVLEPPEILALADIMDKLSVRSAPSTRK